MRGLKGSAFAVLALAAMLLGVVQHAQPASAQDESLELISTTYYIIQGDNELITGDEATHDFTFLRILSFRLPHNVSRVHMAVPSDARNITAWVASQGLMNTTYGREDSGPMEGSLYIDVPAWFERNAETTNTTNNSQSILASGCSLTDVSYDSGALHLVAGATMGTYVSALVPTPESINIVSANVTLYGTLLQNVSCEVSNDHGSTWTIAVPGTNTTLATAGTSFRVRLGLQGDETTPTVTGFRVNVRYLLPATTFTVHLTYAFAGEFVDGKAVLDLTEPVPYASGGSSFVFLYVVKGYSPEGTGIGLALDEDGDSSEPDKDVFVNMSLSLSGSVSRSIQVSEPETDWTLPLVTVSAIAAIGGGAFVVWRRRPAATSDGLATEESDADEGGRPAESQEDLSKRKAELMERKAEIARKLDELSAARASGAVNDQQASKELETLKGEFRKVRNELNRVSKKTVSAPGAEELEETDDAYDSVLASIARLDEDFEKGRLPEKTYRSLRKEYTSKAASMLAEREAAASGHPLEKEKTKLMEAIVALEEEHECGQVDAKVYSELQSSYRKELADILRQIEESKGE